MEFHPFSTVPVDECMSCGRKYAESRQSEHDEELCHECYMEVADFGEEQESFEAGYSFNNQQAEEEDEEDLFAPTAEDLADFTGNY